MTAASAAGILRRRRDYLVRVVAGKHSSNLPHRHEDQEIEALELALSALDSTGVASVTPPGVPSRKSSPTQGDRHG